MVWDMGYYWTHHADIIVDTVQDSICFMKEITENRKILKTLSFGAQIAKVIH